MFQSIIVKWLSTKRVQLRVLKRRDIALFHHWTLRKRHALQWILRLHPMGHLAEWLSLKLFEYLVPNLLRRASLLGARLSIRERIKNVRFAAKHRICCVAPGANVCGTAVQSIRQRIGPFIKRFVRRQSLSKN